MKSGLCLWLIISFCRIFHKQHEYCYYIMSSSLLFKVITDLKNNVYLKI